MEEFKPEPMRIFNYRNVQKLKSVPKSQANKKINVLNIIKLHKYFLTTTADANMPHILAKNTEKSTQSVILSNYY